MQTTDHGFDAPYYAGVLLLENNKTYGRTPNQKRLLYKCIPDNKTIPSFLVPYELDIGFSKKYTNKYILFRFDFLPKKSIIPHGQITETLGNVDDLEVFYEYQLYCKGLHISISSLTAQTRKLLQQTPSEIYIERILADPRFTIQDRRQEYTITIDPQNSLDFDDGFSITAMDDGTWKISVYIANVYFWLEILGLWSQFTNRSSTIYLPDKRRTMLPPILSDSLCSLQEKQSRFAFTMDLIVDENGTILGEPYFCNSIICIAKNYHYEDSQLTKDLQYNLLLSISKKINTRLSESDPIVDSHDVVAFWMIQMNRYCAEYMIQNQFGIFRSATIHNRDLIQNQSNPLIKAQYQQGKDMDPDTKRMIQLWGNSSGQYALYNEDTAQLEHAIMGMKAYVHITSPIRRLVDLLNQMSMMRHLGIITHLGTDATAFLLKWLSDIDYINTSTKNIRKVQTECEILQRCFRNPDIIGKTFEGIVFDKTIRSDGKNTYMVFLEKLKILANLKCPVELDNYSKHSFKIYFFQDEHSCKKKIRLHLCV